MREIETEIRCVIRNLRPPGLDAGGLIPAAQLLARNLQEVSGVACEVKVKGEPYRLPSPTEIATFRVLDEALHNIAYHSGAETASITLDFQPARLCVTVRDDGRGFDYRRWVEDYGDEHLGLLGMRERVESLGGEMEMWSEAGQGTRLTFRVPVVRD